MLDLSGLKPFDNNGYTAYYIPEHHLAGISGIVYEHQIVAEQMLGRELKPEEVVHHEDRNKHNNSFDNLLVFKTKSDHTAYHNGCEIVLDGDVWTAIKRAKTINVCCNNADKEKGSVIKKRFVNDCPICGNEKTYNATMCIDCYNKEHAKNIPPREELYELLKSNNMCAIGRMYNVSDNSVRKWCKKYGLPYKKDDLKEIRNSNK